MVWVPGRTGTHLGGNWVEVDDKGNEQIPVPTFRQYTARELVILKTATTKRRPTSRFVSWEVA